MQLAEVFGKFLFDKRQNFFGNGIGFKNRGCRRANVFGQGFAVMGVIVPLPAFWLVAVPQAGRGALTAGTLAWARALGEFGPVLVFAGATRGSTEVLATTVFLEISIGNLEGAVAVSFLMVTAAVAVLTLVRLLGTRGSIL